MAANKSRLVVLTHADVLMRCTAREEAIFGPDDASLSSDFIVRSSFHAAREATSVCACRRAWVGVFVCAHRR